VAVIFDFSTELKAVIEVVLDLFDEVVEGGGYRWERHFFSSITVSSRVRLLNVGGFSVATILVDSNWLCDLQ